MKEGIAAIIAHNQCGMPVKHIESLINVAEHLNIAIGFRPINPWAKTYIEEGCPSKPFLIKNKTSTSGPMAGLISIDPQYGKLPESQYEKHSTSIEELVTRHENFVKIPLILSAKHIELLIESGQIEIEAEEDGLMRMSWYNKTKIISGFARKIRDDDPSYEILAEDRSPILVLGQKLKRGDTIETKPITADYDLLVACPSWDEFDPGSGDKSPLRTQGTKETVRAAIIESQKTEYTGPREEQDMGNVSPRLKYIIHQINQFIALNDPERWEEDLKMVHHNAEFTNPFADDLGKQLPAILFFPIKLGHQGVVLIETEEELMHLRAELQDNGYYWPTHAKYKEELPAFSPSTMKIVTKFLDQRLRFFSSPSSDSTDVPSEDDDSPRPS